MESKDEEKFQEKEENNNFSEDIKKITNENDTTLLNKKTNPESHLIDEELKEDKNKQKKLENTPNKVQEYEYGYIINFLEDSESGLMEDFLPSNIDSSDFYNYGLNKEEFDKLIQDSLIYHYENHLKEEKEKRDKMNMFMFNMNINMNMNNMDNNFISRGMSAHSSQMNNFIANNMNYIGNNENNINKNKS